MYEKLYIYIPYLSGFFSFYVVQLLTFTAFKTGNMVLTSTSMIITRFLPSAYIVHVFNY